MSATTICTTVIASLALTSAGLAQSTSEGPVSRPAVVAERPAPDPDPDPTDRIRPTHRDKAGATRQAFGYDQIFIDQPDEGLPNTRHNGDVDTTADGNTTIVAEPSPRPKVSDTPLLDMNDLVIFVDDYFADRPTADVNGDGKVTTTDLLTALNTLFDVDLGGG